MNLQCAAHVQDGRFYILGLSPSEFGPIPFAYRTECEGVENGPVDMTSGELPRNVQDAIGRSENAVTKKVELERIKLGAAELVDRARDGDQVAMAILQKVGQNARAKQPRAMVTYRFAQDYIKRNPTKFNGESTSKKKEVQIRGLLGTVSQGIQTQNPGTYSAALGTLMPTIMTVVDLDDAAVVLSWGPALVALPNPFIEAIATSFPDPADQDAFRKGTVTPSPMQKSPPALLGYVLGIARRIQIVRLPESSISVLSAQAALELE